MEDDGQAGGAPATMRAAFVRALGGPENIEVGAAPVPSGGPHDVLVRVEAAPVNHVDRFVRSGAYATPTPFPFVIGRDAVGTVVRSGAACAHEFAPGDRVWTNSMGHRGRQGTFAEYALVPADRLYPLPDAAGPVEAAAVLHTAATAHLGLFRHARLRFGETVVIEGAAGGVGSAAIQLAAAAGARVVATASADDAQWCRDLGAEEVLDYRAADLAARLDAAAPGGADVWWDNSGRNDLALSIPRLRRGGRLVLMSGLGAHPALPVGDVYTRDASIVGFAISNASVDALADAAAAINVLLTDGRLRVRAPRVLRLDEAAEAHRQMERGAKERIVVVP